MSQNLTLGSKTKLGIFITLSIGLFIACIYFIGQRQQMFNKTFQISAVFKDIGGLQVGNNVRFAGINVGIIEQIQLLTDTTVKVDIVIDEKTRPFIKKTAKAIVGSDGLMGNKILLILPGTVGSPVIEDNDFLTTSQPMNFDDILLKLKSTTDNAASITSDLAIVMKNIRQGKGTIGKLLMDKKLANNVDQSLVNIKNGASGFNDNMDAAKHSFFLKRFFKKKKKKTVEKEK